MTDLKRLREQATKKSPDLGMVSFPAPTVLELLDRIAELERRLAAKDAQIAVLADLLGSIEHVDLGEGPRCPSCYMSAEGGHYPECILSAALTPDVAEIAARYREALEIVERVKRGIEAHTQIASKAHGTPSEHYIIPMLRAVLGEQFEIG